MNQNLSSSPSPPFLPKERPITPVIETVLELALNTQNTPESPAQQGSALMLQNTAHYLAEVLDEDAVDIGKAP